MKTLLLGFLLLITSICVLAESGPPTEQEKEIERQKIEEFKLFANYVYYEFLEKDFECKIGSSMTRFYDMATDKCLSCEENKNISYDFCTVQDQIKKIKLEMKQLRGTIRKQTYNLNEEVILENENLINNYKTLFISMVILNSIFLSLVTGVGFIIYKKMKAIKQIKTKSHKEKTNDPSLKIYLNHQIEHLQKSIKRSSKDDMDIYNYQQKDKEELKDGSADFKKITDTI